MLYVGGLAAVVSTKTTNSAYMFNSALHPREGAIALHVVTKG